MRDGTGAVPYNDKDVEVQKIFSPLMGEDEGEGDESCRGRPLQRRGRETLEPAYERSCLEMSKSSNQR